MKAAALDVITFPIQAPFLLAGGIDEAARNHSDKQFAANQDEALAAINKDPAVVLTWDLATTEKTPRKAALTQALKNNWPAFTDDLLREIIRKSPPLRDVVYASPAVSTAFIRADFAEELRKDALSQPSAISAMIYNPNMPDDLLLEIVRSSSKNNNYVFSKREGIDGHYTASVALIRLAFEDELRKETLHQPSALFSMIDNPKFPDDLKFEVLRYAPKYTDRLFERDASTDLIRAAFEGEMSKEARGEPNALYNIISNRNFPDDLKFEVLRRAPKYISLLFDHDPSEALIRAAFEEVLRKSDQGDHWTIIQMARAPQMPDDLKIIIIQRSPKNARFETFSERVMRAVFDDQLEKATQGQPNVIWDMLESHQMPDDLLRKVEQAPLAQPGYATLARNELSDRAEKTAKSGKPTGQE